MLPLLLVLGWTQWTHAGVLDPANLRALTAVPDCVAGKDGRPVVFLTVSSLSKKKSGRTVDRQLEMNWFGSEPFDGDRVLLLDRPPDEGIDAPLASVRPLEHPEGYFRTDVHFAKRNFTTSDTSSQCLGFWIAYVRNDQVSAWSCIRSQPSWMYDNRQILRDVRLRDMMLPGTHNSGTYLVRGQREDLLVRYMYTQDEDVFNQLVYGNRVLDLRVGYYKDTPEKFWINHSFLKTRISVLDVLRDVRKFLEMSNEIVVLDFHRFPAGFDDDNEQDVHRQLIELILSEVGDYMIQRGDDVTLGQLWDTGKRLLVAYSHRARYTSRFLWPGVHQAWGDTTSVSQLKNFFQNYINTKLSRGLWAAMAALTPSMRTVFFEPNKGLRGFADDINRNVTVWFRDLWWKEANIVSTDYFLGNNIVDVAISANRKRKLCLDASD